MFGPVSDHQVHVFVSNGTVAHFTLRELRQLYMSWQMWLLIAVGFFIMSTGHPITMPQFDSFGQRFAFWVLALLFYLVLSEPYAKLADHLWSKAVGKPIPLILLSLPLVMASTYATGALLTPLFEPGRPPFNILTWQMNLRNVLVVHIFETVALLWLLPVQRVRQAQHGTGRDVILAGRKVALADILRVKAAEHYLEIYNCQGVVTVRERMATFLDQVRPEDGIQTHRSHWVAKRHATDLTGSDLGLNDGEKVPVARGRLEAVRGWLAARKDSHMVG
jgi:hypothetical protein